MNHFHHCKCVLKRVCRVGIMLFCLICGGLIESPWEYRPHAPDHGNERVPFGDEGPRIDPAGMSVSSTATHTGPSSGLTFDPAKLIRKDWPDRS